MNPRYFLLLGTFAAAASHAQLPAPSSIQMDGACPAGYVAEGSSCVPGATAKFVISKVGDCPDAYDADGNYCVATPAARLAIRKAAMSCPSAYQSSGNYCLSPQ